MTVFAGTNKEYLSGRQTILRNNLHNLTMYMIRALGRTRIHKMTQFAYPVLCVDDLSNALRLGLSSVVAFVSFLGRDLGQLLQGTLWKIKGNSHQTLGNLIKFRAIRLYLWVGDLWPKQVKPPYLTPFQDTVIYSV